MKKQSIRFIFLILFSILLQTSCGNGDKAKFEQAKQLQQRGDFMLRAGETDSAQKCYLTSVPLYKELLSHVDSTRDTLYNTRLSYAYNRLGCFHSVRLEVALSYFVESLKLARTANQPSMRLLDEKYIAYCYLYLGQKKEKNSPEQKDLFGKAGKFMMVACLEIDSADDKSDAAVDTYDRAYNLFNSIGDSIHKERYLDKYFHLKEGNNR